jgi:hypothetical protein
VFLLTFIITLNIIECYINLVVSAVETTHDLVKCDFMQTTHEVSFPPPPSEGEKIVTLNMRTKYTTSKYLK